VSLKGKKFKPRLFDAELFELRQNLPSFAFSNRPFYTPEIIEMAILFSIVSAVISSLSPKTCNNLECIHHW